MIVFKKISDFFYKYYAHLVSIFVLIFYILTLAPGVIASDSGELATVQYTLGIAHPTGYPLFTILGYVFSHIPFPIRPITKLNFLTALWSILTVFVLIKTIKRVLDNYKIYLTIPDSLKDKFSDRFELSEKYKIIIAVFGGLTLGFSRTFWFNSLSVEVYSLHIFLFSLSFYFMTQAFESKNEIRENKFLKDPWFLTILFLALGFTNHLSTVYIVPGFLYLYFYKFDFTKTKLTKFFIYSIIGFIILSVFYLYIPLRAMMQPFLNWGNPVTFKDFINHISGRLYHQFLFPGIGEYFSNIGNFINTLTISFDRSNFTGSDFSISIIISFLGIIISAIAFRKLFNFLMLILITTVLISSTYNIPDIDSYYLPAHYVISFFSSLGLFYLLSIEMREKLKKIIAGIIIIPAILFELNFNYLRVDLSNHTIMDDYTNYLLNSVEKNSIVLSSRSSFYFPSLYYQLVEGVRKDVVIAEYKLLQQKWYYTQLNKLHPESIVLKDTVVSLNMNNREVYFAPEMIEMYLRGEVKISEDLELVPVQFLYKLSKRGTYVESPPLNFEPKFTKPELYETKEIKEIMRSMLFNRTIYELVNGKFDQAKMYLEKIKKVFPNYELPVDLQKLLQQ